MKELSVCQYFMRIVLIFYCGLPEVFQYVLLQVETYDLLVGNSVPLWVLIITDPLHMLF